MKTLTVVLTWCPTTVETEDHRYCPGIQEGDLLSPVFYWQDMLYVNKEDALDYARTQIEDVRSAAQSVADDLLVKGL